MIFRADKSRTKKSRSKQIEGAAETHADISLEAIEPSVYTALGSVCVSTSSNNSLLKEKSGYLNGNKLSYIMKSA